MEKEEQSEVPSTSAAEQKRAALIDVAVQHIAANKLKAAVGVLERHYTSLEKDVQEEAVKYAIDTFQLDSALHKATATLGYLRQVQALTEASRLRSAAPAAANREFREQSGWWAAREAQPAAWFPPPAPVVPPSPKAAAATAAVPRGARPVSPRNTPPSTPAPPPRGGGAANGIGSASRRASDAGEPGPAAAAGIAIAGAGPGVAIGAIGGDRALRPTTAGRRTPRASAPGSPAAAASSSRALLGVASTVSSGAASVASAGAASAGGASAGSAGTPAGFPRPRRGASSSGVELQGGGGGMPAMYDGGGDAAVPGAGPVVPMPVPRGTPRYTVNLFQTRRRMLAQGPVTAPLRRQGAGGGDDDADGDVDGGLSVSASDDDGDSRGSGGGDGGPVQGLGPDPGPRPVSSSGGLMLGTGFRALADEDARDGFRELALNAAAISAAAARVTASNAEAHTSGIGRAIALVGGGASPPLAASAAGGGGAAYAPGGAPRRGHQRQQPSPPQWRQRNAPPSPPPPLTEGRPPPLLEPKPLWPPSPAAAAAAEQGPSPPLPSPPEANAPRRPSALVLGGVRRSLPADALPRAATPGLYDNGPFLRSAGDDGAVGVRTGGTFLDLELPARSAHSGIPNGGVGVGGSFGLLPTPPPSAPAGSRLGRSHRGVLHSHPSVAQSLDSPPRAAAAAAMVAGGGAPGSPQPPRVSLTGVSGRLRRGPSASGVLPADASDGGAGSSGGGAAGGAHRPRLRTLAVVVQGSGGGADDDGRGNTPGSTAAGTPTRALLAPSPASQPDLASRPESPAVASSPSPTNRSPPLRQIQGEPAAASWQLHGLGAAHHEQTGSDGGGGDGGVVASAAVPQRQGSIARPRSAAPPGSNSAEPAGSGGGGGGGARPRPQPPPLQPTATGIDGLLPAAGEGPAGGAAPDRRRLSSGGSLARPTSASASAGSPGAVVPGVTLSPRTSLTSLASPPPQPPSLGASTPQGTVCAAAGGLSVPLPSIPSASTTVPDSPLGPHQHTHPNQHPQLRPSGNGREAPSLPRNYDAAACGPDAGASAGSGGGWGGSGWGGDGGGGGRESVVRRVRSVRNPQAAEEAVEVLELDEDPRSSNTSSCLSPTRLEPAPLAAATAGADAASGGGGSSSSQPAPAPRLLRQGSPSRNGRVPPGSVGSVSLVVREREEEGPLQRPASSRLSSGAAAAAAAAASAAAAAAAAAAPAPLFSRRTSAASIGAAAAGAAATAAAAPATDQMLSVLQSVKAAVASPVAASIQRQASGAGRARRASTPVTGSISSICQTDGTPVGMRLHVIGGADAVGGQAEGRPWEAPPGVGAGAGARNTGARSRPSTSASGAAPAAAVAAAAAVSCSGRVAAAAGGGTAAVRVSRLSSAGDGGGGSAAEAPALPVMSLSGEEPHLGVGAMPAVRKRLTPVVKQTLDI